jgi:hypothetical protein
LTSTAVVAIRLFTIGEVQKPGAETLYLLFYYFHCTCTKLATIILLQLFIPYSKGRVLTRLLRCGSIAR